MDWTEQDEKALAIGRVVYDLMINDFVPQTSLAALTGARNGEGMGLDIRIVTEMVDYWVLNQHVYIDQGSALDESLKRLRNLFAAQPSEGAREAERRQMGSLFKRQPDEAIEQHQERFKIGVDGLHAAEDARASRQQGALSNDPCFVAKFMAACDRAQDACNQLMDERAVPAEILNRPLDAPLRASSPRAEAQAVPEGIVSALKEAIELRIKLYQNGCDCGSQHVCNAAQKDPYASKWAKALAAVEAPNEERS